MSQANGFTIHAETGGGFRKSKKTMKKKKKKVSKNNASDKMKSSAAFDQSVSEFRMNMGRKAGGAG